MKSLILKVLNSLVESTANLIAGALIYLVYKAAAIAAFFAEFFKAVLYEHIASRSITLFLGVSWLMWVAWTLLSIKWRPRHKGAKMFRAAVMLGKYDQFVFSLYCTLVGVCVAAFLASLAGIFGGAAPKYRYVGVAGLLLLLSSFLPTFWLQPQGGRDLPSIFAPRDEVDAAEVTGKFVVSLLLIPTALYLIGVTILSPIQFVID